MFFKCSSSFRISVHVISIIMNLGQNVQEDWPLFVRDNMGEDHAVIMKPGDMVLYEARTIHARQIPLRGSNYDNLFVHFIPRGQSWYK